MKLNPAPFERIKNGTQTVEVRLFDEKRRLLQIGDEIEFALTTDETQKIKVKVLELLRYDTFAELFGSLPAEQFGGGDANGMYQYYTKENEIKYGVLGIRMELIK
jgi:ASC-1-like (ASCH) protein